MSFEKIPILGKMLPTFEGFVTAWNSLKDKKPYLKPYIEEGLKWVYKYHEKVQKNNTYTIAMCKSVCVR